MADDIPQAQAMNNSAMGAKFLLPSPIPTRRSRTYSQSERALKGPSFKGKVKTFCREKGHGFIIPENSEEQLFVHISDIDGDYVPHPEDDVTFKQVLIPPKNDKYQAVHVQIVHMSPKEPHETWDSPCGSPTAKTP